ncbi:hypothetical protein MKEN_00218500 [Mycena kentingensis (nom. inval.)]|nr:hypothetical protein MKEN_00218500 [Mycena kentingensis (nom. inval.)]
MIPAVPAAGDDARMCPGRHVATDVLWISMASILATLNVEKCVDAAGKVVEPRCEAHEGLVVTGLLYLSSAKQISEGLAVGYKGAFAASVLLAISSVPRIGKGPVPKALAVASSAMAFYYSRQLRSTSPQPRATRASSARLSPLPSPSSGLLPLPTTSSSRSPSRSPVLATQGTSSRPTNLKDLIEETVRMPHDVWSRDVEHASRVYRLAVEQADSFPPHCSAALANQLRDQLDGDWARGRQPLFADDQTRERTTRLLYLGVQLLLLKAETAASKRAAAQLILNQYPDSGDKLESRDLCRVREDRSCVLGNSEI